MEYNDRKLILNKLKEKPFIKQRTDEWFSLRQNILTASDLYDAINQIAKTKEVNAQ